MKFSRWIAGRSEALPGLGFIFPDTERSDKSEGKQRSRGRSRRSNRKTAGLGCEKGKGKSHDRDYLAKDDPSAQPRSSMAAEESVTFVDDLNSPEPVSPLSDRKVHFGTESNQAYSDIELDQISDRSSATLILKERETCQRDSSPQNHVLRPPSLESLGDEQYDLYQRQRRSTKGLGGRRDSVASTADGHSPRSHTSGSGPVSPLSQSNPPPQS